MLEKEPSKRPSATEVLEHSWFNTTHRNSRPRMTRLISAVDRLRKYQAPKRLRAEGMKVLLKFIPEETVGSLKDIFIDLDTSHKGFITAEDLRKALNDLGYDTEADEICKIVREVDYSSQGRINYSQFLSATLNFKDSITEQVLRESFAHFDIAKKGFISQTELKNALLRDSLATDDEVE
jgi:Ca2+-binding EF-hand superfamily protein